MTLPSDALISLSRLIKMEGDRLRVVRCSSGDQPARANLERLYHQSSYLISIVYGDAARADEDAELLEPKIWDEPKGFRPIRADAFLAPQDARRLACDIGDPGRCHLEVIFVMRQDADEVVSVPGTDPFFRKVLGELAADHRVDGITGTREWLGCLRRR